MAIKIRFNISNNPENPTFVLAKKNENKIGLIDNITNIHVGETLGDLTDISFTVHKELNGNRCKYWNSIKNFRKVWCKELNAWFVLKIDTDESTEVTKQISCVPVSEFDLSNSIIHNLEINTETDINRDDYSPTIFYSSTNPKVSLLNRILSFTRGFTIKHVDTSLQKIQRTLSLDGDNVYNTLRSIQEEFNCVFIFGSGSKSNGKCERTVSVYDLYTKCNDCGYRSDFDYVCPKCGSTNLHLPYGEDTSIFITSEDLAEQITLNPDTDSVKNCFRLISGDDYMDAAIMACNPNGSNYIWYFSEEMKEDMSEDLLNALENYDILYNYYQNEYILTLDSDLVSKYNDLILKYKVYNSDLYEIVNPIQKYSGIMNEIYNVIDFNSYLQTALMPTINMETSADVQAKLIVSSSMGKVAVKSLSAISKATADNAVLDMTKTLIDSRYSVKIKTSSFDSDSYMWQGNFTITSYTDEEDTAETGIIMTVISDNYEEFVKQKIEKTISKNDTDNYDISGLFKLSLNEFKARLKKYSLDCLNSIYKACDACIGVMVEMGISSPETAAQSNGGEKIYTDLYYPHVQKMWAIESEIKTRENEIGLIDQVYQKLIAEKNYINDSLDIEEYLGEELYNELYSYKMEGEYNNSNYISTGLSNAELFGRAREFIDTAERELYKSAHIKYTISTNLRNLLVIDKFKKIVQYFQVGNWIRVKIDDAIYKLKLLSYSIDYDDLSHIDVEFSDVSLACNNSSAIKNILEKASSMSKSYDCVKRQASQGEDSNRWIESIQNNGIDLTSAKIMNVAKNQTQYWDENGFLFREYDPVTDDYLDEQLKIVNSTLAVTADRWKTCKAAIGRFYYYDPKTSKVAEGYGVIADTLVGNLILSKNVGIYNEYNTITLDENGLVITSNGDDDEISTVFTIQKEYTDENGEKQLEKQLWINENGDLEANLNSLKIQSKDVIESINNSTTEMQTIIDQTAEAIRLEAQENYTDLDGKITETNSAITETAKSIRAEVNESITDLDGRISENSSAIKLLPDSIESSVKNNYIDPLSDRVTNAESNITQTAESITANVNAKYTELDGKISENSSAIQLLPDSISTSVKTSYIDPLTERVTNTESSIKVNSDNIETKVSKDNVISSINQSPETISISASKINLTGAVTISSLNNELKSSLESTESKAESANQTIENWCYENDTTIIDGSKLATGTVTAKSIAANAITTENLAISDFTNYATVNEFLPNSLLPGQVINNDGYTWVGAEPSSPQFLMMCGQTVNGFKVNDVLRFKFTVYVTTAQTVTYGIWFYNANHEYANGGAWGSVDVTVGGTGNDFIGDITISSIPDNAVYYCVGFEFDEYTSGQQNQVRSVLINKISGRLQVGQDGFIDSSGAFKIGAMKSVGSSNQDVEFKKAIFVDYGVELLGGNDGTTPYLDFHKEATDRASVKYDYTARMQNTEESWITFYGKQVDGTTTPEGCTVQAAQYRGTFVQDSDKRLKEDINELDLVDTLESLMKYRPVSYKYINGVDKNIHHGLIAQEAQNVADWGLVDDRGQYLAINYTELVADLIKVTQYSINEINNLKGIIKEQQNQITELLSLKNN